MNGPAPMDNAQPSAGEDKAIVEKQLEALLRKAKQIADANGVDFRALVSRLESSEGGAAPSAPPMPPSAQSPLSRT